ncbi:TonB-dependent receptor [Cellulophaga baltica]|uniref:TonB-dependent receptor n=1 Tax=Cellulophaga TaxID=104264 RepID=UPI001C06A416|nr:MULTISPECIES: TonB-dependent receptor [Cellulophaga]MBU2995684.1 TonB-dependent receptor [Cellulophaga baltica]MDO6767078.1 TonB-dependent receptor [Cellulophaga sp. 1_MG-2023]
MRYIIVFYCLTFHINVLFAQSTSIILGEIRDAQSKEILKNVSINLENDLTIFKNNEQGAFALKTKLVEEQILIISLSDYTTKRIPVFIDENLIELGVIYLGRDISIEKNDNLITLTDAELHDDEVSSNSAGLLQATRDIFLNKAAFDFGQAFFRVRGYDSKQSKVLINGTEMNKFYDGRPQWNNWGGLNDVTRNQQFTNGLQASVYSFGGVLGVTNIDTRPSKMRSGLRLSSSASNRTYGARIMATYTAPISKKGLAYSISGSRRWSKEGYISGTLYDAYSFFGALEYKINDKNSFLFTSMLASNRRGRSSAITEEVFNLVGNKYNPYWGIQNGKIRNSRERKIAEPIVMFNHFFETDKLTLTTGVSYQTGENTRSRLGYYDAPNPDPTYYRYLPSFYLNSSLGANFLSANTAKVGFIKNPQLNWNHIYTANSREKAAYVLYDDVIKDTKTSLSTVGNFTFNNQISLDFGLSYRKLKSKNYALINDLLGADYHEDIDTFSNTLNDINSEINKTENDIFNYNYTIRSNENNAFVQFKYELNKWKVFLSVNYKNTNHQRDGLYQNERFIDNSLGKSDKIKFSDYGIKTGLTYKLNGRNWLQANGAILNLAPTLQNVFINPRENNLTVPDLTSEKITTIDASYFLRFPKLTGRFTSFYTRFQNTTDINFFFVDTGVGSDFVQEVLTGLDKLHMGTELGLEYQLSPAVQLTAVAAVGKYVYANNPSVTINFDTSGAEEDLINLEGAIALGEAKIKDYKLAQGPQKAFALGINYRDPKYWWAGLTANYLANNYANISTITRTRSFYIDPETGQNFADATEENVNALLAQKSLDNFYLLNVVGGKSWLKNGKYISVFASVSNVFDAVFRTGGYEQSRNGNYGQLKQDNLSGRPSFAPKYWYGYGRTYFLNFSISL